MFVADLFKSRAQFETENLFLRHQVTIALRQAPPRPHPCGSDWGAAPTEDSALAESCRNGSTIGAHRNSRNVPQCKGIHAPTTAVRQELLRIALAGRERQEENRSAN
jgi:hypothetical protein